MGWSTEKINIEELKRQALLGDEEAQRECTRRGIVLPCPFCKGHAGGLNATILKWANTDSYVHERTGKCFLDGIIIGNLAEWNTRPAPFIRLCKDCSYKQKATVNEKGFLICPASGMEITDDDFCSYFEENIKNG